MSSNIMTSNRKIFAERLRELRKDARYTQPAIAEKIGVKTQAVNDYEHERSAPSFDVLILLADTLNVSVSYLVGQSDDPKVRKPRKKD